MSFIALHVDVKRSILTYLSIQDLINVRQVNKHLYHLYCDDLFWHLKMRIDYGSNYIADKPQHLTWREWYRFWKTSNRQFVDALSLSPHQGYINITTKRGYLHRESENYLNVSRCLEKALLLKSDELVSYFTDKFIQLKDSFFQEDKEVLKNAYLVDYYLLIPLAFSGGYNELAKILTEALNQEISVTPNPKRKISCFFHRIATNLGKRCLSYEFKFLFLPLVDINFSLTLDFILGLIIGHHNKEAALLVEEIITSSPSDEDFFTFYEYICDGALVSDNKEFLTILDTYIPEDKIKQCNYLRSNVEFYIQPITCKNGLKLTCNKDMYDEVFKDAWEKKSSSINVDFKSITIERFQEFFLHLIYREGKCNRNDFSNLLRNAIKYNRYDIVDYLIFFKDSSLLNYSTWLLISQWLPFIHNHDIILYFLMILKKDFRDIYRTIRRINNYEIINYDTYLFIKNVVD